MTRPRAYELPRKRQFPRTPSVERLRKSAKKLLRRVREGDEDALARVAGTHPNWESEQQHGPLALHDTQWVLAREYGFESWTKMIRHVEEIRFVQAPQQGQRKTSRGFRQGASSAAKRSRPGTGSVERWNRALFVAVARGNPKTGSNPRHPLSFPQARRMCEWVQNPNSRTVPPKRRPRCRNDRVPRSRRKRLGGSNSISWRDWTRQPAV